MSSWVNSADFGDAVLFERPPAKIIENPKVKPQLQVFFAAQASDVEDGPDSSLPSPHGAAPCSADSGIQAMRDN
ncbi:hypothetical protein EYC84_000304 [Monilinia fructicola]|uniref:Uncharacterized protein n=1 Tax=Monilinia fructicola TaxID=38448 RepID=A0A5M9JR90_MONFR|nr:hypothetical protein EYC84_000304 [Monilinia fructicola]